MWIALSNAFLSIVQPKPADFAQAKRRKLVPQNAGISGYLCVRGRKADHIRRAFPGCTTTVKWTRFTDYPARAFIKREEVASAVQAAVAAISYENFKDSVKNDALHDAYLDIWSVMNRYGRGGYDSAQRKRGHLPGDYVPWTGALAGDFPYDDGDPASDDAALDYVPRSSLTMKR